MALSKRNNIKWKKSDYITLGIAVSNFNKKIRKLQQEEKKLYLPEIKNYNEVKENILTRSELNRVINSLKRFAKEGAEEIYITQAGEQITKWQRQELGIQKGIAKRYLKTELQQLNIKGDTGFSRAEMGSEEKRRLESTLKSLEKLETTTGYEFERISQRIRKLGTTDYTLRKAYVFRENFMEELEKLKNNSPEFQEVFEHFNSIKDPITFFNETQKSNALQDFFVWYKTPENYASFDSIKDLSEYIIKEYS